MTYLDKDQVLAALDEARIKYRAKGLAFHHAKNQIAALPAIPDPSFSTTIVLEQMDRRCKELEAENEKLRAALPANNDWISRTKLLSVLDGGMNDELDQYDALGNGETHLQSFGEGRFTAFWETSLFIRSESRALPVLETPPHDGHCEDESPYGCGVDDCRYPLCWVGAPVEPVPGTTCSTCNGGHFTEDCTWRYGR